jgi:uncharacterized coiled-coil protein SlyX
MGSLSNLYISQSYQSLIHLGTNNTASATLIDLQDGLGNSIGVAVNTNGDLSLSGSLTASLANGYVWVGNSSNRTTLVSTSSFGGGSSINTGSFATTASFNQYTQSTNIRLNNLESTSASVNVSISNLNSTTASQGISITNLNSATQSLQSQLTTIGGQSGSWVTESETGSFARYDVSNPWSANQTFTNITAVSASFTYVQTTYETSSVIYSSGSNQFGDATNDIQTLIGQTKVSGSLGVTGSFYNNTLSYPTTDGIAGQFITTNGAGTLTFDDVHVLLEDVRYGENITLGDPLYVSGSNGTRPVVYKANAAIASKMPVIYVANSTAVANTNTTALTLGLITGVTTTGYAPGTTIYVAEGTAGWSASRPSGSNSIVQALGIVTKEGPGGSGRGLVLNPGPATLPNLQTGYAWVGNDGNQPVAVLTSSFSGATINTGSFATTSSFNSYTSSNNQRVSSLETNSASVNISISNLNSFTASNSITSLNTFSASTLTRLTNIETTTSSLNISISNLNLFTASNANTSLNAYTQSNDTKWTTLGTLTGSYATTGSNLFTGIQTFRDNALNATSLVSTSGSIMLVAKSYTSASAHITGSTGNLVNFIFKDNNNTGDTVLSGSNNMFGNPVAPTAGFKRFASNGNIALYGALPQISSSMAFPISMNGNFLQTNTNNITLRGPVSASAWTIAANFVPGTINIGVSAASNAEKLLSGLTISANYIQGGLNLIANQSALTGSANTFSQNFLAGTAQLELSSSALNFTNNIINDAGFTLKNQFYNGTPGLGVAQFIRNNIAGTTETVIISGSQPAGTTNQPFYNDNAIFGGSNIIYGDVANARTSGTTAYHSATRNIMMGNSLILSASSAAQDANSFGSVFAGRWNVTDGRREKTAENVLVVGTGTSTTRKTGFLIDSGSNTFVEGSFNVSGSTNFTGSVKVASTFQLQLPTGSNQQAGTAVLDGGTPASVVVSNSLVTANSIIMLTKQTNAVTPASVSISAKSAGSFTISSTGVTDTDTVGWFIINNS